MTYCLSKECLDPLNYKNVWTPSIIAWIRSNGSLGQDIVQFPRIHSRMYVAHWQSGTITYLKRSWDGAPSVQNRHPIQSVTKY